MELISQHTKKIMEECKIRASAAGLVFADETLEYIVTNRDMLELSPKVMIPTLYDYWVHDVEVLREIGKYKLYPHNPYETVINSRPAISFYNDNNPDWLNIMIFYHVLGHIDFFQNNLLFQRTWNDDFVGQALADKRLIESLRSQHGRWVDYAIEFSRSIDNLVGYFETLPKKGFPEDMEPSEKVSFYFYIFLQEIKKVSELELFNEIDKYNKLVTQNPSQADEAFFAEVRIKYPEFIPVFEKNREKPKQECVDIMEYIRDNSPFLRKEENVWMRSVMNIVRNTALYFGPQMRTKIINEGWASFWHDELFRSDDRIKGNEVAYARLNAGVTSLSRIGLNPYAIGLRLIQHVEEQANKGKICTNFQLLKGIEERENFDQKTGKGREAIFNLRSDFSDFTLVNTFVTQDFTDEHDLFVVGQRINQQRGTKEYYIKSRKAEDYKEMLINTMIHPVKISVDERKTNDKNLYLVHEFENRQIYKPYIPDTLIGIEYLWGAPVQLETIEIVRTQTKPGEKAVFELRKILYTSKDGKVLKVNI
ncbi:MAG: SpoVR family protein [Bacteroidetes bacterium RIFOXYA12_FULL_35_11]|nr:MAG: SpoVR family protein [Bacteroidetes bacterium GWF2_35_48]OFY81018.1 MAG: SpoVR family protein [Bacteroidetes bacterium RIFOXYA12_FULL_35_11]HBX49955.1 SpoVR family protein [Bacteroidales bacterium]